MGCAYENTVVPGKDGKLIQASDEIPAGSDVSGDEDANCEDGERVHVQRASPTVELRGGYEFLDIYSGDYAGQ